jgi:hypothetical protein
MMSEIFKMLNLRRVLTEKNMIIHLQLFGLHFSDDFGDIKGPDLETEVEGTFT